MVEPLSRIEFFVGGIPANVRNYTLNTTKIVATRVQCNWRFQTNEHELKSFFDSFGSVKDVKIISDRAGVSKGYGFVTFDAQDVAEKIINNNKNEVRYLKKQSIIIRILNNLADVNVIYI